MNRIPRTQLRNFCIIAHIDHGKSTLADRLLELTGTVNERDRRDQLLDQLDLERERGITIKAQAVRLEYRASGGELYHLNLIDTPGHVDFSYEVSRSLAACEGALLLVDAAQGVEAQTLANLYLALDAGLEIIPVINKIDLPNAEPDVVAAELEDLGFEESDIIRVSAKTGQGVPDILEAIVSRLPPPQGDPEGCLRALVFDSHFDPYKGVVAYVRVIDGALHDGMRIRLISSGRTFEVTEVGVFRPYLTPVKQLGMGEVGFVTASMKEVGDCRVGDTITNAEHPATEALPGYRKANPMVFCGLYPAGGTEYDDLRDALERYQLNDAAFTYEAETSEALGFGFRCGFLGLLHMEIVQERLEREYELELVTTAPSVVYEVTLRTGDVVRIDNPARLPERVKIEFIAEPYVTARVSTPADHLGGVMELCEERRGTYVQLDYRSQNRVDLRYDLPLAEIMYDFFDQLKSRSRGYATLDYELAGYRVTNLVKVDVLVNGEPVDALSFIIHADRAEDRGRQVVRRLRELIPRQLFEVPIQAAIGAKIIARETIPARRKDVLAKCYGGDVTRKRKLLERQKEGKQRMKQIGSVEIPQEAFMAILEVE